MFADISFPISSYKVFTYKIPEELIDSVQIGVRVKVPFGSRGSAQGVVVHRHEKPKFKGRIRSIKEVVDETPIFDAKLWDLLNRSEEHTSELQSRTNLVCRLLLEKKKKII